MKLTVQPIALVVVLGMSVPILVSGARAAEQNTEPTEGVEQGLGRGGTNTAETAIRRDPFWPVGYTPKVAEPEATNTIPVSAAPIVEEPPVVAFKWPELHARGVTETPEKDFIAFLDGIGMIEEGDTVRLVRDGVLFVWHVDHITKDGAELRRVSASPKDSH